MQSAHGVTQLQYGSTASTYHHFIFCSTVTVGFNQPVKLVYFYCMCFAKGLSLAICQISQMKLGSPCLQICCFFQIFALFHIMFYYDIQWIGMFLCFVLCIALYCIYYSMALMTVWLLGYALVSIVHHACNINCDDSAMFSAKMYF